MIGQAIFELLNIPAITDLLNPDSGINHTLAPQKPTFPYVVFNEEGVPENFKNDFSVVHHDVQIDIYCAKGKDGNGGFAEADAIAQQIRVALHRFNGIVAGKFIAQTLLESEEALFDPVSEAARVILEYRFRENVENNGVGYWAIEEGQEIFIIS